MLTPKKIMTTELVKIKEKSTMLDAYKLMFFRELRHLPVYDDFENLVGILSERDLQRAFSVEPVTPTEKRIVLRENLLVEDFMSTPVFMVPADRPLTEVIEDMLKRKISAVLVSDETGSAQGILTTEDLLQCLMSTLQTTDDVRSRPLSFFLPNTLY